MMHRIKKFAILTFCAYLLIFCLDFTIARFIAHDTDNYIKNVVETHNELRFLHNLHYGITSYFKIFEHIHESRSIIELSESQLNPDSDPYYSQLYELFISYAMKNIVHSLDNTNEYIAELFINSNESKYTKLIVHDQILYFSQIEASLEYGGEITTTYKSDYSHILYFVQHGCKHNETWCQIFDDSYNLTEINIISYKKINADVEYDIKKLDIQLSKNSNKHKRLVKVITVSTSITFIIEIILVIGGFRLLWKYMDKQTKQNQIIMNEKMRYMAQTAHDFNTPITILELKLGILLEGDTKIDNINHCISAVDYLKIIANRAINLSKMKAGISLAQDSNIESFHVRSLFETRITNMIPMLDKYGTKIDVTVQLDETVPEFIQSDPEYIFRMVNILLSNSYKFTVDGYIKVICRKITGYLIIDVFDSGTGVHKLMRPHLFEEFASMDTQNGGSGIGLFECSEMCKALGGTITYSDNIPKGAHFKVQIPVKTIEKVPSWINFDEKPLSGISILFADDVSIIRLTVGKQLQNLGATVYITSDGSEALNYYKTTEMNITLQLNVILLDIMMPVMNGPECCSSIRKIERRLNRRRIPIFALTANADVKFYESYRIYGFTEVHSKPFNVHQIARAILKYVRHSPLSTEEESINGNKNLEQYEWN